MRPCRHVRIRRYEDFEDILEQNYQQSWLLLLWRKFGFNLSGIS